MAVVGHFQFTLWGHRVEYQAVSDELGKGIQFVSPTHSATCFRVQDWGGEMWLFVLNPGKQPWEEQAWRSYRPLTQEADKGGYLAMFDRAWPEVRG